MAQALKCLCCGEPMEVTATQSKQKPYANCEECGVQVFVRGRKGVKLFEEKYGSDWRGSTAPPPPPGKPEQKPAPHVDSDTDWWKR